MSTADTPQVRWQPSGGWYPDIMDLIINDFRQPVGVDTKTLRWGTTAGWHQSTSLDEAKREAIRATLGPDVSWEEAEHTGYYVRLDSAVPEPLREDQLNYMIMLRDPAGDQSIAFTNNKAFADDMVRSKNKFDSDITPKKGSLEDRILSIGFAFDSHDNRRDEVLKLAVEAAKLESHSRRLGAAQQLLRELQWSGYDGCYDNVVCPSCEGGPRSAHLSTCRIALQAGLPRHIAGTLFGRNHVVTCLACWHDTQYTEPELEEGFFFVQDYNIACQGCGREIKIEH